MLDEKAVNNHLTANTERLQDAITRLVIVEKEVKQLIEIVKLFDQEILKLTRDVELCQKKLSKKNN